MMHTDALVTRARDQRTDYFRSPDVRRNPASSFWASETPRETPPEIPPEEAPPGIPPDRPAEAPPPVQPQENPTPSPVPEMPGDTPQEYPPSGESYRIDLESDDTAYCADAYGID